ncbi:hypothetical protein D4764_04G0004520 [Takifugu flavidus]|uniref:Uncharacterized protein n=1 Tax=Takifugu flavidus TaxID=433684 RepID=A0A5C6N3V8_9TELE|nr:hypothetical protein D4764_04G0004520 [Takifugu flavidus]
MSKNPDCPSSLTLSSSPPTVIGQLILFHTATNFQALSPSRERGEVSISHPGQRRWEMIRSLSAGLSQGLHTHQL